MMQFEIFAGIDWSAKVRQVAVAIEKPHGPEVDALLERGIRKRLDGAMSKP